jgi:hypothetical protein
LPTRAKLSGFTNKIILSVITMTPHPADRLEFPLRQALPTPGKEDRDRMRGLHNRGADLKETLDEFHGLDIGHRPKDGASETLTGRTWFSAPRQGVEGL